jgi:hypothetical protein
MTGKITLKTKGEPMTVDLPDDWVNYGDVNPRKHGGMFATFAADGVQVIETRPPNQLPDDMATDEHLVWERYLYYGDVLDHTGDETKAEDVLKKELSALHDTDDLLQAAMDARLPMALVWASSRYHAHRDHFVPDSEYTDALHQRYGINKEVLPDSD